MDKTLSIVRQSTLRPGQLGLYKLIVTKIDTGELLKIDEAEHIWLTKVHSDTVRGIPYHMDYYANRYERNGQVYFSGARVPMERWEIDFLVINWLMKNIGLLVLRGYLKVIPMVELKRLEAL